MKEENREIAFKIVHVVARRIAGLTHPIVAAPGHPLCAAERVGKKTRNKALFPRSEERADKRSVVGVSRHVAYLRQYLRS